MTDDQRFNNTRDTHAATATKLYGLSWRTEATLRMPMNDLDSAVAK